MTDLGSKKIGSNYQRLLQKNENRTRRAENTDANIPFGDREIWNEDDIYAYITNPDIEDDSLLIDIEPEDIERNVFDDRSGYDFVGMGISDYKVRFDNKTLKPIKNKFISRINIGRKKDGAF